MRFKTASGLVMAAVLALATVARGEMLAEGWQYRRPLAFKQIASDAPGENVAWAEFYTNGQQKPDGSDLRVTTSDRQIVPHKVMQVSGENDLVRIAFQTHSDGPYFVWWGNPKAAKPEKEVEVRRGIFVEVFQYPGGLAENAERLTKAIERAKAPVGEVFVNEIFLGHNPLGEEWNALLRYGGQFKIDKDVTASLAFTVNDTGWLKIDGNMVAQEYRRGIQGDVRNPKAVDLKAGWHSIEVVQANQNGGPTAVVVAWKRPADKGYAPIPGAIFAQAAAAAAGPLEKIGATYAADFSVEPTAEAFSPPDAYLQRYVFEAAIPATYKPTFTWDFGDGQTASGALKKVHHYYMTPGIYAVSLRVEQGPSGFAVTERIAVKDRMYARFPRPPEDGIQTIAAVFKDYNLAKLNGEQAFRGMMIFKKHEANDSYVAWGRTWAGLKDTLPEKVVFDEVFDLARLLQQRKEFKEAAGVYLAAAGKPIGMDMRLNLLRYFAMTACDYLDDAAGAMKELNGWEKKINEANRVQMHTLLTAKVYVAVALGDEKAAKAALADAGMRKNLPYNEQEIRQGVLARNIESYMRTKDFDTALKLIDQWELEYPDSIWDGFTRTLRVRLYAAEGRPGIAARVALQLAKANTQGFYAAELLYRASVNFKAAGEETQAKAALDLLKSKYPESPYARDGVKGE